MLKTTPENLMQEIESAQRARDEKLRGVSDSIARYQGPDRGGRTSGGDAPENVEFEYISYMMPSQVFDRPRVVCESTLLSRQDDAMAIQVGLNRWIRDTRFREPCLQACLDTQFSWTCLVTSNVPAPELGEVEFKGGRRGIVNRPFVKRISNKVAFKDPTATSPYDMRFAGHAIIADKDDLLAQADANHDEGWIPEIIRGLATDTDLAMAGRRDTPNAPTRDEVTYYQVWVSDAKIDWKEYPEIPVKDRKRYHGKLFYISTSLTQQGQRKQDWIRKPQPFYGPRSGPYEFIGTHLVPDDADFMATTQPMRSTIKVYNDLADVANRAQRNYKRIILVNDLQDDLPALIRDSKHEHVYSLPGYERGSAESLELGGVTNQMGTHLALLKDRVDRGLGMSDAQRGAVTGDASATENALAAEASSARMSYAKKQFTEGIQRVLNTVAWYLWYDDEVSFPISLEEFAATGGELEDLMSLNKDGTVYVTQPRYYGGVEEEAGEGDSFDGLELEIQPYSMERMSEAKAAQNATTIMNLLSVVLPMVRMYPEGQWDWILKTLEQNTGISDLAQMVNLQVAADMAQSEALMKQAEFQQNDGPRMGGDSKASKPPSGGQSAPAAPASPTQQPQSNVQKPKAGGLPGRTTGGSQGAKAAQSVGAA